MSIQDGTTNFKLSRPTGYKHNGSDMSAGYVMLKEPSMEHTKFYLRLKQMITRAQMEMVSKSGFLNDIRDAVGEVVKPISESAEDLEKEAEGTHEALSMMLLSSETVDVSKFMSEFEKMAVKHNKKSICLLDGVQVMTQPIWNTLRPDDAFNMAVRWCAFFAMPSQEGERTTSELPPESRTPPTVA